MALSAEMILRIDEAILELAENPRPDGVTSLQKLTKANRCRNLEHCQLFSLQSTRRSPPPIVMLVAIATLADRLYHQG
jgi:hypothetical protein